MLSKEAIEEFKEIWKAEYKQRLSDREATERAIKLISLFKVIYKPISYENSNKGGYKNGSKLK